MSIITNILTVCKVDELTSIIPHLLFDVPELDHRELCELEHPDDLFLLEDVEGRYQQEERYSIIEMMEREYSKMQRESAEISFEED